MWGHTRGEMPVHSQGIYSSINPLLPCQDTPGVKYPFTAKVSIALLTLSVRGSTSLLAISASNEWKIETNNSAAPGLVKLLNWDIYSSNI